ncbi:hypothetical protein F8388_010655 [Cannabis sativa]|uniref:Uncharacterized protein n=1 Tax=Cannabis sativa TaxID=3483 RepID=A0A7J6G5F9_CANSA|nr:hypothetical protein F8388_010655 [Cannabis sativa]
MDNENPAASLEAPVTTEPVSTESVTRFRIGHANQIIRKGNFSKSNGHFSFTYFDPLVPHHFL